MTISLDPPAYQLPPADIERLLETNAEKGLSKQEAKHRHEIFGDNSFEGSGGVSIWKVFIRQVANALTLVFVYLLSSDHRYWLWQWHCRTGRLILSREESLLQSLCVREFL